MKHEEIVEKIKTGEALKVIFGIRKITYAISDTRISERQFTKAKDYFKENLALRMDHGGLTRHYYTLKQ